MAHFNSLLRLDRRDLEFIWLLTAGWDQVGLHSTTPLSRRLFLVDTGVDEDLVLAFRIGAAAAGFHVLDVPASILAAPASILERIGSVADGIALADRTGAFDFLHGQGAVPVVTVEEARGAPVHVLGHLYRWFVTGKPMRGLRVVWQDSPQPALRSWCEATAVVPLDVTHVGETDYVDGENLHAVRRAGQQGTFRRLRTVPDHDVTASQPLGVRTLACTFAALLEHAL